jgi:hypothetical protein
MRFGDIVIGGNLLSRRRCLEHQRTSTAELTDIGNITYIDGLLGGSKDDRVNLGSSVT